MLNLFILITLLVFVICWVFAEETDSPSTPKAITIATFGHYIIGVFLACFSSLNIWHVLLIAVLFEIIENTILVNSFNLSQEYTCFSKKFDHVAGRRILDYPYSGDSIINIVCDVFAILLGFWALRFYLKQDIKKLSY